MFKHQYITRQGSTSENLLAMNNSFDSKQQDEEKKNNDEYKKINCFLTEYNPLVMNLSHHV